MVAFGYEERWRKMSEIRSWDEVRDPEGNGSNLPCRIVMWPEGAPKQEDVPHAGEGVLWGSSGKEWWVNTGIPYKHYSQWILRLSDKSGNSHSCPFNVISKPPATPPQTYTEEEVREALGGIMYEPNIDLIIKRLRGKDDQ